MPLESVRHVLHRHLELSLDFYGPERGLILFRKHAQHYLAPCKLPAEMRQQLLTTVNPKEFLRLVADLA